MLTCMKTAHCTKIDGHSGACGKPAATAPDVRTAAQAEARRHILVSSPDALHIISEKRPTAELLMDMFTEGAVWGAALVTPTREQIAEALYSNHPRAETRSWADTPRLTREIYLEDADAVLALVGKLPGARD